MTEDEPIDDDELFMRVGDDEQLRELRKRRAMLQVDIEALEAKIDVLEVRIRRRREELREELRGGDE